VKATYLDNRVVLRIVIGRTVLTVTVRIVRIERIARIFVIDWIAIERKKGIVIVRTVIERIVFEKIEVVVFWRF
jgi:hypothetical protein